MKNKTISVVIPTCDRGKLLRETVKSVLKQSFKPKEIIIINNGSKKIRKNYIKNKVTKIKIINTKPYIGPAKARNKGAKYSKGDYIAFLDDDDIWPKNYLKIFYEYSKNINSDCYLCKSFKFKRKKFFPWKDPKNKIYLDYLFIKNPGIGGSNIIVRTKIFSEGIKFDHSLTPGEDKGYIIDLILNKKKISVIEKNFIYYRASDNYDTISSKVENVFKGKLGYIKKYFFKMNFITKFKLIIIVVSMYFGLSLKKIIN